MPDPSLWEQCVSGALKVCGYAIFESNFWSALFGAGFGAWAAYRLSHRAKRREELLREFDAINAAILLASDISSALMQYKLQHIMPLVKGYRRHQAQWLAHRNLLKRDPEYKGKFKLDYDGRRLVRLHLPVVELRRLLYDRIRILGRAKRMMPALEEVYSALDELVAVRNTFIDQIAGKPLIPEKFIPYYLGLPTPEGRDQSYCSMIRYSRNYVNDAIWFAHRIGEDLNIYGVALRKRTGMDRVTVARMGFEEQYKCELPPDARYPSWIGQDVYLPNERASRIVRKWRRFKVKFQKWRGRRPD